MILTLPARLRPVERPTKINEQLMGWSSNPVRKGPMRFTGYGSIVNSNPGGAPQKVAHEVGAQPICGQFLQHCIGTTGVNPGDGPLACIF